MDPTTREAPDTALLRVANMAFGAVAAFRRGESPDFLEENIACLEHALELAFPHGDPFVRSAPTEAMSR
jgi:hypothetical protein